MTVQEAIANAGIKSQRLVWTGKEKPATYATYQTLTQKPLLNADDEAADAAETTRVTLFTKGDYTAKHAKLVEELKKAGFYINEEKGAENYESETGYYMIPITIQKLIEKE